MEVRVNNKKYIVTDMIVIGINVDSYMKYNIFDENYKYVTTINAEDEIDFMRLFNIYLSTNKK